MKFALPVGIVPLALVVVGGCARKPALEVESSHREDVRVTVYKSDFGEVQEVRRFDLAKGSNDLHVDGISNLIDPETPLYEWLNGFPAEVVSSSYELGVNRLEDLLQRYEGKQVAMVWYGQDGRKGSTASGLLERGRDGQVLFRTGEGLLVNPTGTLVLPDEKGLAIRPSLSLRATSDKDGEARIRLSYLTRGLSWTADYSAFVNHTSDDMSLECWASVENRTGLVFPVKKLALVAGSPNRAARPYADFKRARLIEDEGILPRTSAAMPDSSLVPELAAQGELYRYEVDSPGLLASGQLNRVKLLGSKSVFIKRDYAISLPTLSPYSDYEWSYRPSPRKQNAVLTLTFSNDKTSSLGIPLPAGAVRVYDVDGKGEKHFTGSSAIGDTTENAKVSLTISNVFNVYSEFASVSNKVLDSKTVQKEYQATLHNQKDEPVGVRVVAGLVGNPVLVSESHKGTNISAQQRQWSIDVPAKSKVRLTITLKFRR